MAEVCIVMLDPELAPRDQTAWAFTCEDDAQAVAGFLNTHLGAGDPIAWVERVPVARSLNENVLRYLDSWAEVADDVVADEE